MNVIEIKNLSKKYYIHHAHHSGESLKETLSNGCKNFFKQFARRKPQKKRPSPNEEEFWALKDLTLDIQEGDRVALLGRNGAGKSTLLKILSRITEPTHGSVKIRGRVSSLLEVGTGFHPDLTGRENILLNGAIMGMGYQEIKSKFDEIVAFADIEKFLDTPLKRYSSGMFMRLGFAIAAHLDSEIMIVDEVLAVGDAQFQEKCLNKMNEIGAQNRTIFFVSHHINSVLSLCNKGIFLEQGVLKAFEPIQKCISHYVHSCPIAGLFWRGEYDNEFIRFTQASLTPPTSNASYFSQGEKPFLEIDFEVLRPHSELILGFTILNAHNQVIAYSRLSDHVKYHSLLEAKGRHRVSFNLDLNLFHPGEYQIRLECSLGNRQKILQGEILLKFALYSQNQILKHVSVHEGVGISLGNQWVV